MQIQVISERPLEPAMDPISVMIAGFKARFKIIQWCTPTRMPWVGYCRRWTCTSPELMVLQCCWEQLQAKLEWLSATENVTNLEELNIYLMRRTRS